MYAIAFDLVVSDTQKNHPKGSLLHFEVWRLSPGSSSRALAEGVVVQVFRNLYLKGFKEPGRKASGEPDELTLVSNRGRIPKLDDPGI